MIMHITTNCVSIVSSSLSSVAATPLLCRPYRRFLHSSSSSLKIALISTLNWSPDVSTNINTKIHNPNYRMTTVSANTSPSSADPAPLSAEEPDKATSKPQPPHPWLIVGLGNPGKRYNGTRHNVGFEMVDKIAEVEGISMSSVSFKALFGKGFIGNVPVMLAKPRTFMNASGESVGAMVSYYKIPLKQVLVIYDDMDLPFAKLRLLPKGGHGGHNGMKSIINHFKARRDFPRLRIGIGRPPGKMDSVNFVLCPFIKEERQELDFMLQTGMEAVRILLLDGFDKSATFVNTAKRMEYNC